MNRRNGLSAVELLITLAVAAILLAFNLPSLVDWADRYRMETAIQGMLRSLALARSESSRRNLQVSLYSKNGIWEHGWSIYADMNHNGAQNEEEILFTQPPITRLTIRGNATIRQAITYGPDGTSALPNGAFQAGSLFFCLNRSNLGTQKIIISRSGRARVEKITTNSGSCSDNNL